MIAEKKNRQIKYFGHTKRNNILMKIILEEKCKGGVQEVDKDTREKITSSGE